MNKPALLAAVFVALAAPLLAEPPTPQPQELPDGAVVFATRCAPCHGPEGMGVTGQIPPLRDSDFLHADLRRAIRGVLRGLQGSIKVNGATYDSAMPAHSHLEDAEIAAALTHVLGWSGVAEPVPAELVAEIRRQSAGDTEVVAMTCPRMSAGCGMSSCRQPASCPGAGCPGEGCCAAGGPRPRGRGWWR